MIPDTENPRIPLQESALETILALVQEDPDGLFRLAKDIVRMGGTNPAELLNVTLRNGLYLVKEGNRRVAVRKILRNPEQLRGHLSDAAFERWERLAKEENARKLRSDALVVVGEDHEVWIDRRHLGPQGGVGVAPWNPQAKARRDARRRGTRDRTVALLDGLKGTYPDRFESLEPPKRTFTTLTRVLDSPQARAQIGIDVDESGNVVLRHGEKSIRLIEEILQDLRKHGKDKLTSRSIHRTPQILKYLDKVETRVGTVQSGESVSLVASAKAASGTLGQLPRGGGRPPDIFKSLVVPSATRPRKLYEELRKARRYKLPNAALILTRVLLELSADNYASDKKLPFAGDRNADLEEHVRAFQEELGRAGVQPIKVIRDVIKSAATRPLSLGQKLDMVIQDLVVKKLFSAKEGEAKRRELRATDVVPLLNDAVHRLHNVPSMVRVDHILDVVGPLLNAMH